jgi:hypothetical protein
MLGDIHLNYTYILVVLFGLTLLCNIFLMYWQASRPSFVINIERAEEDIRVVQVGYEDAMNWHEDGGEEARTIKEEIQNEVRDVFHGSMNAGCSKETDLLALRKIRDKKIFIAADLHNNAEVLGHWLAELLKLVTHLKKENVFVSIYDSSSSDTTPTWVMLLRALLRIQDIPHHVVSDPFDGREYGQHRIDFMAYIRNKALEPLPVIESYQENVKYFFDSTTDGQNHSLALVGVGPSGGIENTNTSASTGNLAYRGIQIYDQIVFLNDVFFCMRDVVRLLLHEVDMACGMDYDLHNAKGDTPQFYDTWVARDLDGKKLTKKPLHFKDESDRIKLLLGQPIQVQCCWNGIAVMSAEPFHRGLRFRHIRPPPAGATSGECKASECSHLCDDLYFNNYRRIIIDPSVKLAYKWEEWLLALEKAEPKGREVDIVAQSIQLSDHLSPRPPKHLECCNMGRKKVDTTSCSTVTFESVLQWSPCLCIGDTQSEPPCECSFT